MKITTNLCKNKLSIRVNEAQEVKGKNEPIKFHGPSQGYEWPTMVGSAFEGAAMEGSSLARSRKVRPGVRKTNECGQNQEMGLKNKCQRLRYRVKSKSC